MKNYILIGGMISTAFYGNAMPNDFTTAKVSWISLDPPAQHQVVQINHPCAQISTKEMSGIMGWKNYSEAVTNQLNNENMQRCYYGTPVSGGVSITFMKYEVRNPEGRYLEKAYTSDLEKTAGKITYEDISGVAGDQMIYSYGMNGPKYEYKIRWREGNHSEKIVEYSATKKQKPAATLEKLKTIALALEES